MSSSRIRKCRCTREPSGTPLAASPYSSSESRSATGILLLVYYRPTPQGAYESVQFIMTRVPFGWLIRSIHGWSANLMILSAFVHMFSVVFLHAYRRPREFVWFSGVVLLVLALAFGFSGYLLPWNKISFFATKVGTDIPATIPWIGPVVTRYLRGGSGVGGATLTRFFGFHVALLPASTTLFLLVHLGLIQKFGISTPVWVEEESRLRNRRVPHDPVLSGFPAARIDRVVRSACGTGRHWPPCFLGHWA